jgi:hypothetical protein
MIETETEKTVATDVGKVADRRSRFARLSADPKRSLMQLAARIKFLLQFYSDDGQSLRIRQIKRGLHADRYAAKFDDAIALLEQRKQIVIRRVSSRSRPVFVVILKQNCKTRLPDPFTSSRKKKRKQKRPPSDWFMARRHLMDAGIHIGLAEIKPWQESAYWLEQEKAREEQILRDQSTTEPE